jgi:carbonic anhydrase
MYKKKYLGVISLVVVVVVIFLIYNFVKNSNNIRDRLSETTSQALVLSCMDFRFVNDTNYFLNKQYKDDYNKFSLAGASLGYNQDKFKEWSTTFDKHIQLSKDLHDINEIVVVDHMDCGAYRILYDSPNMSKEEEYQLHRKNLNKFRELIHKKHPSLKVTMLLTNTDGSVMAI